MFVVLLLYTLPHRMCRMFMLSPGGLYPAGTGSFWRTPLPVRARPMAAQLSQTAALRAEVCVACEGCLGGCTCSAPGKPVGGWDLSEQPRLPKGLCSHAPSCSPLPMAMGQSPAPHKANTPAEAVILQNSSHCQDLTGDCSPFTQ